MSQCVVAVRPSVAPPHNATVVIERQNFGLN